MHQSEFINKRTFYTKLKLSDCISPRISFETQNYQRVYERIANSVIDPNITKLDNKGKKQFEVIARSKYLSHTIRLGGIHSNGPAEILTEDSRYAYIDIECGQLLSMVSLY